MIEIVFGTLAVLLIIAIAIIIASSGGTDYDDDPWG